MGIAVSVTTILSSIYKSKDKINFLIILIQLKKKLLTVEVHLNKYERTCLVFSFNCNEHKT